MNCAATAWTDYQVVGFGVGDCWNASGDGFGVWATMAGSRWTVNRGLLDAPRPFRVCSLETSGGSNNSLASREWKWGSFQQDWETLEIN